MNTSTKTQIVGSLIASLLVTFTVLGSIAHYALPDSIASGDVVLASAASTPAR